MKKLSIVLLSCLMLLLLLLPAEAHPARVVDESGTLDETEIEQLTAYFDQVSLDHNIDVVVYMISELPEIYDAEEAADDFYDHNGYGLANNDGVLLFVAQNGYWHVSTCGKGHEYISEYYIDQMADHFIPYLKNGDYAGAFRSFVDDCENAFTSAENGEIIEKPFSYGGKGVLAGGIGFLVSLIITGVMKGKLHTVKSKDTADDYIREGSLNVTQRSDLFLYSHVARTPRQTESSRSGGSGTHISSSGVSHGGHGGRF